MYDPEDRVVVGVDGSNAAREALLWAAGEARVRGSELVVVVATGAEDVSRRADQVEPYASIVVREAVAEIAHHAGSVEVGSLTLAGDPVRVLVEASKNAGLLVVGKTGAGWLADVLIGSVALAVVDQARCPVVVVPERRGVIRRGVIAVGVADSLGSRAALELAFAEASRRGAAVLAVHANRSTGGDLQDERSAVSRLIEDQRQAWPGVPVVSEQADRTARETLLLAAARADLLVLASRADEHARFGAGAAHLLRDTRCPTLIVNPHAAQRVLGCASIGTGR